ncbi:MAG TPA: hypothetical protein VJO99_14555 [Burkholderiaceae bacterium]|nr:hypothetical protein [Burkholderiaceae bacterium]
MKLVSHACVLGAVMALGGCGTTASDPPQATTSDIDYATVNAINNVARSRGVQVYWIHYPRKAVKNPESSSTPGNTGGAGF